VSPGLRTILLAYYRDGTPTPAIDRQLAMLSRQ
jgi:hypothetical protein